MPPMTKSRANFAFALLLLVLAADAFFDVWDHFAGKHVLSLARLVLRGISVVIWSGFALYLLRRQTPFFERPRT